MLALFASALLWADQYPTGATIDNALVLDVPPAGLQNIAEGLPNLIPEQVEIPPFADQSSACPTGGYWYKFEFKRAWATIELTDVVLIPQDGYIDYQIDLTVTLNDPADMFRFNYWLVCIKYKCDGYADPFQAQAVGKLRLELTDTDGDGVKEADVNIVDDLSISYDLTGDYIHMSGCAVSGIEDIFQFFGGSLYDLVLDSLDLNSILTDSLPELEVLLEDTLTLANIDEELALGDASLRIQLAPNEIQVSEDGLRIIMNGGAAAPELAECVDGLDPGGSLRTDNPIQELADFPADYDLGAIASDDFVNQALYALWSAGLLCQTIDEEIFALDTTILNLLSGDAFVTMFPDAKPVVIRTSPASPPSLKMDGASPIGIDLEDFGLNFYADVDDREARVLALDLKTDVGVALSFDNQTGAIKPSIDIDPSRVTAGVSFNEFVPDQSADIEDSFVAQLDTILGFIDIDGLLGDLNLVLPALGGATDEQVDTSDTAVPVSEALGIQEMAVSAVGGSAEDVGLYATVGTVSYGATGCASEGEEADGCGGCGGDTSGCGGGCASGGPPNGREFLLFAVVLMAFRRRYS